MENTELRPLEYLAAVRRRKWWLIVPVAASIVVGLALVRFLPKTYTSQATLAVTAPAVSTTLVGRSASLDNQDRVRAISQQLLSSSILSRVVSDEGLAADTDDAGAISRLRRQIHITVPDPVANTDSRELNSFVIAYEDATPDRAQRITNRLATVFVDENSRSRAEQAAGTSAFIGAQVQQSEARLNQLGEQLRAAKEAHMGSLPEQTDSNLQTLAGLRQQLEANATALRSEQDRLSMLEQQIDAYAKGSDVVTIGGDPATVPAGQSEVTRLENELAAARAVYTEKHPEVQRLEESLAAARQALDAGQGVTDDQRMAQLQADPTYRRLLGERETSNLRIRNLRRSVDDAQRQITAYQARIEAAPRVEQELAALQQNYELERQQYAALKAKQDEAAMAENVARTRGGEQFAVLYPASFPTEPTSPVPLRVLLVAILAGCCIGGALMLGTEYLDDSVHGPREIADDLKLPVLGSVPRIVA